MYQIQHCIQENEQRAVLRVRSEQQVIKSHILLKNEVSKGASEDIVFLSFPFVDSLEEPRDMISLSLSLRRK